MKGIPLFTHFRLSDFFVLFFLSSILKANAAINISFGFSFSCETFFFAQRIFVAFFFSLVYILASILRSALNSNEEKKKEATTQTWTFFPCRILHNLFLQVNVKIVNKKREREREKNELKQQIKHMQLSIFICYVDKKGMRKFNCCKVIVCVCVCAPQKLK